MLKWTHTIGDKPWVYIAHRKNSCAVNPTDYKYLEGSPSLKGLAIVTPEGLGRTNAELEEKFFNKPFQVFDDLDKAFDWSNSLINS